MKARVFPLLPAAIGLLVAGVLKHHPQVGTIASAGLMALRRS